MRSGAAPGSAAPPDDPHVPLRLIVTRGALGIELYEPVEVGPISVRALSLTLPGLRFPLDVSGGVRVFRHRRGDLERVDLWLAPGGLARWLGPRLREVLGPLDRAVAVWSDPPRIGVGLVSGATALAFDLLWAPSGGDARFVVDNARGANLDGPALGYALRAVDAALGDLAERRGRLVTFGDAGAALGRAILPAIGARAPAAARVRFGALGLDAEGVAVELDSTNPPPALAAAEAQALELALLAVEPDEDLARGDVDAARNGYVAALEQAPRHPAIAGLIAEIDACAGGRDEAALGLLVEAVDPIDAGVVAARLLAATGDVDGAREAVRRAATQERFAPVAALHLRWLAEIEPQAPGRVAALDEAIARAPALACVRWARFDERTRRGDVAGALADAEHLEAGSTGYRARHAACARAARGLLDAGFAREAGRWFERALRYLPDDAAATAGFARTLIEVGKPERAFALLERAVALAARAGGSDADALVDLARLLASDLRDLPQAISRVRQVPSSSARAPEARALEARWRAALGDIAGASLAWARLRDLVELSHDVPARAVEWLRDAARFEREQQDVPAAERHLAVALRASPRDPALGAEYREAASALASSRRRERPASAEAEPFDEAAAMQRADQLEAALRGDPDNPELARSLLDVLERLGRDRELYALLSARLEDADASERDWLVPRAREVLARLESEATGSGRDDEARLYREARARLD